MARLILLGQGLLASMMLAQPASVPGTRVSLVPPPGMQAASRFAGFESTAEEVNIMVVELAAPRAEAVAGFRDAEKLKGQRMELLGVDQMKLGGATVELFRLKQRHAGSYYFKYVLALGDQPISILTAMAEEDVHEKWKPLLLAALGTVVIGEKKGSIVGFSLEAAGDLKEARAVSNQMLFTPGGTIPVKDRRGPMFLGTRSLTPVPVASLAEFAETRARALNGAESLTVVSSKALTLAGLEGHELVARANDAKPETAMLLYEVVLREKSGGYYLLIGMAPAEQSDALLPLFRKMANSFRLQ